MNGKVHPLNLVVAACSNRGIGKDGTIPWTLRGDMSFFRKITSITDESGHKNVVIMGRKTYFSIPEKHRPLANRINIVLSSQARELPESVYQTRSFDEALKLVNGQLSDQIHKVFIIGGSSVYQMALDSPIPHRIYLTTIHKEFDCDTFLPNFDTNKYQEMSKCKDVPEGMQEENEISYEFKVYDSMNYS